MGQALAGACGRQLHRAALNCRIFVQKERAATGGSQITRGIAPRRCHPRHLPLPPTKLFEWLAQDSQCLAKLTLSSQSQGFSVAICLSLYLFYRQSRVHRVLEGLGPRFRTLYTSLQEVGARAPRRVELLFSLLRCRRTTPWPGARLWRKQGGSTFGIDSARGCSEPRARRPRPSRSFS